MFAGKRNKVWLRNDGGKQARVYHHKWIGDISENGETLYSDQSLSCLSLEVFSSFKGLALHRRSSHEGVHRAAVPCMFLSVLCPAFSLIIDIFARLTSVDAPECCQVIVWVDTLPSYPGVVARLWHAAHSPSSTTTRVERQPALGSLTTFTVKSMSTFCDLQRNFANLTLL